MSMGPRVFAVVVESDNQPAGKPGSVVLLLECSHNESIEEKNFISKPIAFSCSMANLKPVTLCSPTWTTTCSPSKRIIVRHNLV